jgi:hypothetical protein
MKTLIVDLFDYQEGAQIVVDRLYGGLDLVEDLAEKKVFCLAKCKSNRPSWLFKDFLHKIINNKKNPEIGDCAIANGTFKFDFGDIPFYAFSVVTKIKNQHSLTIDNFISTSHDEKSLQLSSVVREEGVMEKDDSVATYTKAVFSEDSIVKDYSLNSGHIDQINDQLMVVFFFFFFFS